MPRTLRDSLGWTDVGTVLCERAIKGADLSAPSALPNWSRATVLGHLGLNARALLNLVAWARTGVETPMYVSVDQRNADIDAAALLPAEELAARFRTSAADLAEAMAELTDEQWAAEVRTTQGRTVPASFIPWLRAREVMIHAVDLASDVDWADLPTDFLTALLDDIVAQRSSAGMGPALVLAPDDSDRRWPLSGVGAPVTVAGPLAHLAAYLAGRPVSSLVDAATGEPAPHLPAWI